MFTLAFMSERLIKKERFSFAVRIVKLFQYLQIEKKEYVLSRQLMRSATAVGVLTREAEYAESKPDFVHKMAIAQKEINETLYWFRATTKYPLVPRLQMGKSPGASLLSV
jgi:four helix bundle protein